MGPKPSQIDFDELEMCNLTFIFEVENYCFIRLGMRQILTAFICEYLVLRGTETNNYFKTFEIMGVQEN